jgi:hypothetical protein
MSIRDLLTISDDRLLVGYDQQQRQRQHGSGSMPAAWAAAATAHLRISVAERGSYRMAVHTRSPCDGRGG